MLEFKTLNISKNNDCIHIVAQVKDNSYTTNIIINKMAITTVDNVDISNFPDANNSSTIYILNNINKKNIDITLNINQVDNIKTFENQLLYVYILATGTPSSNTPCGQDNPLLIGVLINFKPIYEKCLSYLKTLSNTCIKSKDMIDYFLRLNFLDLAIKCNDYVAIQQIWKELNISSNESLTSKCGCNAI